jgi:hypothetical protein
MVKGRQERAGEPTRSDHDGTPAEGHSGVAVIGSSFGPDTDQSTLQRTSTASVSSPGTSGVQTVSSR